MRPAAALLTGVASASASAQQPSAQTTVAISVRVQPTLAIHGVVAGAARTDSGVATTVSVESNLPYRLTVRRAPARAGAAPVLVRGVTGAHEILCRAAASAAETLDAGHCALVYQPSAEYHDTLLRTTALSPARPPASAAYTVAEAATGR